jgi:hypothetical protein
LITETAIGKPIVRQDVEELLKAPDPERFNPASLKSFAQNINGSWTKSGFLKGRSKKQRSEPVVTPVNVTFALFQAYLKGATAARLLHSATASCLASPSINWNIYYVNKRKGFSR